MLLVSQLNHLNHATTVAETPERDAPNTVWLGTRLPLCERSP